MPQARSEDGVQLALLPDPNTEKHRHRAKRCLLMANVCLTGIYLSLAVSLGTTAWYFITTPVLDEDAQVTVMMLALYPLGMALACFMIRREYRNDADYERTQAR